MTMADQPLISVLICNRNYGRFLGAAIESVLEQRHPRTEVVVVDDASDDESSAVLERYGDQVVKVYRVRPGGQGDALIDALAVSRGEIITLLDADDICLPGRLRLLVEAFAAPGRPGLVLHGLRAMSASGVLGPQAVGPEPLQGDISPGALANAAMPCVETWTSGIALRRDLAERVFPVFAGFPRGVDFCICGLGPVLAPVTVLPGAWGGYRLHGDNISQLDAANALGLFNARLQLWRRFHHRVREMLPPGLAARLAPLSRSMMVCMVEYLNARVDRRPRRARAWYRRMLAHPDFGRRPLAYRLYWRLTPLVPSAWMLEWFALAYGRGATKQLYWHARDFGRRVLRGSV